MSNQHKTSTIMCHAGENRDKNYGAVVSPIYQNSLFTFNSWEDIDEAFSSPETHYIYTRGNNPTAHSAEIKIAKLCDGEKAKLFSSGMAAISSAIMHCVKKDGHVIAINNVYGPVNNFLSVYLKEKMGIETTLISGTSVDEFKDNIRSNTCLIYLESPSSVVFSLQDIHAVTELARQHHIKTIIDNTWATPIFQKPLTMGVDIEVHSCSKYICGHSDVVAGVMIAKEEIINAIFNKEHAWYGGKIAPFEAWLINRSLRTLDIRMYKHQQNGMSVAYYLENHSKVNRVDYPGLKSFPQYELGQEQMSGYSSLLSFQVDCQDVLKLKNFLNHLKIFRIGVSWGGHESLAYIPAISYLKEMTPEQIKKMGISLGNIRLSIGLEDIDDILSDLENALKYL